MTHIWVAPTGVLKLQIKEVGRSPSRAAAKKEDGRLSIWLPLSPPQGEAAPEQSGLHIVLVQQFRNNFSSNFGRH